MKKLLVLLAICGVGVSLAGCMEESSASPAVTGNEKSQIVLWKKTAHGNAEFDFNKEVLHAAAPLEVNEKAKFLVDLLKQKTEGSELEPVVPEDVSLLSAELHGENLTLNFNGAVKFLGQNEGYFVKSINYTMLQNFAEIAASNDISITYQINGATVKTLSQLECNKNEICWEPFLSSEL
ncbi:hypothetical protein CBW65_10755 [Tumebacillus avium]|uniref:GerMN domain-containing protein n=1 Tax=Tumebacillus avium TaxID=1903704 RepID=A0A1Y0IMF9_9BACL|nr:GerMN domain-containing protein [Tumebacillus avium]ARU61430.1 hypothetical protein CBW65_10755 [Tumebacillus avium]